MVSTVASLPLSNDVATAEGIGNAVGAPVVRRVVSPRPVAMAPGGGQGPVEAVVLPQSSASRLAATSGRASSLSPRRGNSLNELQPQALWVASPKDPHLQPRVLVASSG